MGGWGEFGGAFEAGAGDVADVEEGAVGDFYGDVGEVGVEDVFEVDAAFGGAGDVGEGEAVEGFDGGDVGAVNNVADVVAEGVGDFDVAAFGDTSVAGDGVNADDAVVVEADADEGAGGGGDVGGVDVADVSGAAEAGFQEDCVGSVGELAVADGDVGDAAGHFGAESDAGETAAEFAVGDEDVLGGFADLDAAETAAGFEGDAVIAGVDVAVVYVDVGGGFDVEAVAVGEGGADVDVLCEDVVAEEEVEGPDAAVAFLDVDEADVFATGEFDHDGGAGVAEGADLFVALQGSGAFDGDVFGVRGGEMQGLVAGDGVLPS